ncbi:HAMP domain-containing protein [Leucobacter zeae]|nr:HAMP domain-containing protein [Leucobacter zeae]
MSARLKLTLSYAGFLVVAGALLLAVVWAFLLRYVPPQATVVSEIGFVPGRHDLVRAFAPRAAWTMLFLIVFGLLGGWILAGRMLAPLARITRATRRAAGGSLSHRIELEGRQDEFRELADSFDSMLARLEAMVAEQQRFAANASHELRTPLAITQTMLDVARSDASHDHDALLARLDSVNARAIDLTEALLVLSRAEQGAFDREGVDLSLIAEEAVELLLPLAEERGIEIDLTGELATVSGSRSLLLQLVTNLLQNAIVHNLATGGTVRLETRASPGAAELAIENTGERLDPSTVASLAEPFQRGAGRIRRDARVGVGPGRGAEAGYGLGLAIAKSIARAHGGTLRLAARDGGGLAVSVKLPSGEARR